MLENKVQVFLLGNRKYPNYEEKYCHGFRGFIAEDTKGQASRILCY